MTVGPPGCIMRCAWCPGQSTPSSLWPETKGKTIEEIQKMFLSSQDLPKVQVWFCFKLFFPSCVVIVDHFKYKVLANTKDMVDLANKMCSIVKWPARRGLRRRHNHFTFSFVLVFGRIQPSIQRAVCARQPDTTTTKQGTAALFLIFLIFHTSASTAKIEHFYKVKHAVVQSSMYRTEPGTQVQGLWQFDEA